MTSISSGSAKGTSEGYPSQGASACGNQQADAEDQAVARLLVRNQTSRGFLAPDGAGEPPANARIAGLWRGAAVPGDAVRTDSRGAIVDPR
jgi:hypothetical protein